MKWARPEVPKLRGKAGQTQEPLCSAQGWLTDLEGRARKLFFANPRTKAALADGESQAGAAPLSPLPSPFSDLYFADSYLRAGRRGSQTGSLTFPPPPFSDSAVIHILINVWWGLGVGPAGTRDSLFNCTLPRVRYKNQT